jgi:hypothetical protein
MIPLLINQSNISRDFSLQLSKCLANSDLVVIVISYTGYYCHIEGRVISYTGCYCHTEGRVNNYTFYHIKANKSKLIDNTMCN